MHDLIKYRHKLALFTDYSFGEHMEGLIYILINKSVPGLVKVGRTSRDTHTRAAELSRDTGVPGKWERFYDWRVEDPIKIEQRIFKSLRSFRDSKKKEFFALSPEDAKIRINELLLCWGAISADFSNYEKDKNQHGDTTSSDARKEKQAYENLASDRRAKDRQKREEQEREQQIKQRQEWERKIRERQERKKPFDDDGHVYAKPYAFKNQKAANTKSISDYPSIGAWIRAVDSTNQEVSTNASREPTAKSHAEPARTRAVDSINQGVNTNADHEPTAKSQAKSEYKPRQQNAQKHWQIAEDRWRAEAEPPDADYWRRVNYGVSAKELEKGALLIFGIIFVFILIAASIGDKNVNHGASDSGFSYPTSVQSSRSRSTLPTTATAAVDGEVTLKSSDTPQSMPYPKSTKTESSLPEVHLEPVSANSDQRKIKKNSSTTKMTSNETRPTVNSDNKNKDVRHCLSLSTNAEIAKCAAQ